jgi:hypothetical protein
MSQYRTRTTGRKIRKEKELKSIRWVYKGIPLPQNGIRVVSEA